VTATRQAIQDFFAHPQVQAIADTLGEPWMQALLALLGLALLLILGIAVFRRRRSPIRVFNNSAGHVKVSRRALSDVVRSACETIGASSRPKVKFWARRGRLYLQVKLRLEAGQRLGDISSLLQDHLSRSLKEILGVDRIGRIDVIATGFRGQAAPTTGPTAITHADESSRPDADTIDEPETENDTETGTPAQTAEKEKPPESPQTAPPATGAGNTEDETPAEPDDERKEKSGTRQPFFRRSRSFSKPELKEPARPAESFQPSDKERE